MLPADAKNERERERNGYYKESLHSYEKKTMESGRPRRISVGTYIKDRDFSTPAMY